jgi:hypothetical protein
MLRLSMAHYRTLRASTHAEPAIAAAVQWWTMQLIGLRFSDEALPAAYDRLFTAGFFGS